MDGEVVTEGVALPRRAGAAKRSTRERISYNASSRFAGRIVGALLTIVALRLATHYFGPGRWGLIVAAMALSGLFVGIADLGISTIASRELAAAGEDGGAVYGAGVLAVLAVAVPLMGVMAGLDLAVYAAHPEVRRLALILLPLVPLNAVWLVGAAVLVAKARNDLRGIIDVATSAYLLAGVAATVSARLGAAPYLWITVASTAAGTVLAVAFARRYTRADLRRARAHLPAMFRQSTPVGGSLVLGSVNSQLDTILLSLFAASAVVGTFGLAYQVAVFAAAVPPMLTVAILPKFMAADDARRQVLLQRSFDLLAVVGASFPVFAVLFARGVVLLIGGARFGAAVVPLVLLSVFAAFTFAGRVFLDALVYVGKERLLPRLALLATSVNLVTAAVTIPFIHAVGASLALIASSLVALVAGWVTFRRTAGYAVSGRLAGKAGVVGLVLLGLYFLLHDTTGLTVRTGALMIPEGLAVALAYTGGVALWGGYLGRIFAGGPVGR